MNETPPHKITNHVKKRALERYNINLNKKLRNYIVRAVKDGFTHTIPIKGFYEIKSRSVRKIKLFNKIDFYFVYDSKLDKIITVLTKEMVDKKINSI